MIITETNTWTRGDASRDRDSSGQRQGPEGSRGCVIMYANTCMYAGKPHLHLVAAYHEMENRSRPLGTRMVETQITPRRFMHNIKVTGDVRARQ